jgi:branched-chain amino acid transport system permease protein
MAERTEQAPTEQPPTAPRPGLGRRLIPENFPVRRVVQLVLAVGLLLFTFIGAYRTFALHTTQGRLSAAAWRDLVVFGIAQGAVIALIALGYSLVYGILLMINFAHGEIFMAGAFGSYFVAVTLDQSGFLNRDPLVSILILLLVAMAVSTFIAVLLERIAYRRLRGAPRLVPLITAIGASLFLQNTFREFFGAQVRGYPEITTLNGHWKILGIPILKTNALVIITAVVAMVALTLFVSKTKTGKSMRAVSQDKEMASLMGINVDKVIVTTFAIGGIMAGIAGVLFALVFGQVNAFMGFLPGIAAFTAAVLGGIGSISGAALGGLIIGVLQSVAPFLFLAGYHIPSPNQLKDVVSFSILVLVLIFRPGGILGTGEAEKL